MAAFDDRAHTSWRIWRSGLWGLVIAAAIALAGLSGYVLGRQGDSTERAAMPDLGPAPSYTMTNQLGQTVASSQFRGQVQLVTFFDPYCTTLCPLIAAHLANLENFSLRPEGLADKVEIVSFDLRPATTGPREMRAFLSQYGWNPTDLHWQYLTGPADKVRRVVRQGFHVWYKEVSFAEEAKGANGMQMVQPEIINKLADSAHPTSDILHNDLLEIVDRQGRVRKIYDDADTIGPGDLLPVIQSLVEPAGGSG